MKLIHSKNLKLRNKTFDWTSKVRNLLLKAKFVVSRELRLKKNTWGVLVQQEKLKTHETDEKTEMAKRDTTKTYFFTPSGSKISIVVTGNVPKTEGDYDVND